jgi:hypothetical protein
MPAVPRAAAPKTKVAQAQETAALRPAPAPAGRPAREAAPARARPGLGTDLVLGHRIDSLDAAVRERCFAAGGEQRYRICLVPVRWPASLQRAFHVQSMLYNGTAAFVLYDGGRAVSLYALFRSRAHLLVDAYYSQTFGQPAKRRRYSMTVGYRRQDENRIATWAVSGRPGEGDALIELRRFDDVRDLYADGSNGVVQVTAKGAPGVFSVLTMLDLIEHKFQRL